MMSNFTSPFDDGNNPFADPSVQQAAQQRPVAGSLDEYNPFADSSRPAALSTGARGASNPPIGDPGMSGPPPPYTAAAGQGYNSGSSTPGHEDLLRRQEELDRKAAELQRREEEMARGGGGNNRNNNWPPIPSFCPVQPCFYQDIHVEIPQQFQNTVSYMYYIWLAYAAVLMIDMVGAIAYWGAGGKGAAEQFGFSILQIVLLGPCSYVLWFRPIYKAFRSDSSINFMIFFFVFFAHCVFTVVMAIGFSGWSCGFISAMQGMSLSKGVGFFMLVISMMWSVLAAAEIIMLLKIHRMYRGTTASFAKAQQEFSQGVFSNEHVQNAAASAASSAVRNQFSGTGGNRY